MSTHAHRHRLRARSRAAGLTARQVARECGDVTVTQDGTGDGNGGNGGTGDGGDGILDGTTGLLLVGALAGLGVAASRLGS